MEGASPSQFHKIPHQAAYPGAAIPGTLPPNRPHSTTSAHFGEAGQAVAAVDVHGAGAADALAA